jgi:hypothetical protein
MGGGLTPLSMFPDGIDHELANNSGVILHPKSVSHIV